MKNLLVVSERLSQVPSSALAAAGGSEANIQKVYLDAPSGRVFILTKEWKFVAYSIIQHAVTYECTLIGEELLESTDVAVGMHYLPELELIHIATFDGNLLTLSPDGMSEPTIVGSINVGIASMCWSPDEELCVLYNRSSQVIVMTKDFDVMYEIDIFKPVPAAPTKSPAEIEAAHARYGYGNISWRGDGQFFVLSALNPLTLQRVLVVYDRQLEQQSMSAGCKPAPLDGSSDGMACEVVWRPSGNLIFTPAHRSISSDLTKREVWMWERNGLRHGEIALGNVVKGAAAVASTATSSGAKSKSKKPRASRDDDEDEDGEEDNDYTDEVDESANLDASIASSTDAFVSDLAWNADSDILSVKLEDKATGAQSIVLYTTGNYHWYLKQGLTPTTPGAKLQLRWHTEDARRLLIVESTGLTRFLDLVWDVSVNHSSQSRLATVIDGQSALLTPLAKSCVPPPMSMWKVNVPVQVGRINMVAVRASPIGARATSEGTCKFTLPNQVLEETAFKSSSTPSIGDDRHPVSLSPTSDLLLSTSSGMVYLCENIEGSLGNSFNTGINIGQLSNVTTFSLRSTDFVFGCLRNLEWLDMIEDPTLPLLGTTSSITPERPAILIAVESMVGKPDSIVEFEVHSGEIQGMFRTPIGGGNGASILRIAPHKEFGSVFVHLTDGRVCKYKPAAWQVDLPFDDRLPILDNSSISQLQLPTGCPWFDVVEFGGIVQSVGRDPLGKLYVGMILLTPQGSSFASNQHPDYMVFTILGQQNAVFLLDKRRSLEENMGLEFRSDPHNVRLIERGAQLVCVVPSLTLPRLILQMPRGNLEGIYPRNFNLSAINSALSSLRLKEAFINLRRNKIDSNLLFDHFGYDHFKRIGHEFVRQIGGMETTPGQGIELLNLFLSNLTEESSIENQYVKYVPLPLTNDAEELLKLRSSEDANMNDTSETLRESVRKQVAEIRHAAYLAAEAEAGGAANGANEDARSETGSLDSAGGIGGGAGGGIQSHDAVGEMKPYNYVPRKHGQPRRRVKVGAERRAASALTRSKEELRRENEKLDRSLKERLAQQYEDSIKQHSESRASKVNFVCDLLRDIFLAEEEKNKSNPKLKGRYTLCILTTYLKNEPKNYDAALTMVKRMKDEENAATLANGKSNKTKSTASSRVRQPVGAEQSTLENKSLIYSGYTGALQYMIFLSDVQTLYKSALGIYDFELVRLVAQYSHMDPKEYLGFLEKLQAMDPPTSSTVTSTSSASSGDVMKRQPHMQHYLIDSYLGRWSRALSSLLSAWSSYELPHDQESWSKIETLLKEHPELYVQAIETMTPETIREETRLVLSGGGGGGGGSFGSGSNSGMGRFGESAPFDPTGGLPAHFLNPSLAAMSLSSNPSPASSSFGVSNQPSSSSHSSASSSTPDAEESESLTPYYSLVRAYATHLSRTRTSTSLRHAAHAFLLCHEWKLALKTLQDAGEWKECMSLALQLGYSPEEVQQVAYDLSGHLRTETKTCFAAAQLLIDYCDDIDEAIVILIGAECWFDILRLCFTKGRHDLLETHVQSEITKAYGRHIKHIRTHRERYLYAVKRLRIIRRVKLLFPPTVQSMDPTADNPNARDEDLMSIVSGVTASTSYSQASHSLSEASAFSGRSTSTVASTSSIFSIQSDDRREMTPDERRIARHKAKIERNRASKKVKEGSIYEEDMMIKEVIATTPLDKHKDRMSELVHALLHFGYVDQSRTLQFELDNFLKVVAEQEALPMPMMENPTPEQRDALIRYWNWPGMCHPDRDVPPKTDHLLMPFLFPKPSTKLAAIEAEKESRRKEQEEMAAPATAPVKVAKQPKAVLDDDNDDGDIMGGMF